MNESNGTSVAKAVIPREVAEAIEASRKNGIEDDRILAKSINGEWLAKKVVLNGVEPMLLARALVNGYVIERTPEEKVRELFARYAKQASAAPYEEYDPSAVQAIIQTLDILGIKIAGVNAND